MADKQNRKELNDNLNIRWRNSSLQIGMDGNEYGLP